MLNVQYMYIQCTYADIFDCVDRDIQSTTKKTSEVFNLGNKSVM